ncbi:MAG: site-specific DNA-methyltransferase [Alphaproteobacteria bacterium]|nr:site-specific DNA-methyltransferase [Alphaproteobacteria bacterium]
MSSLSLFQPNRRASSADAFLAEVLQFDAFGQPTIYLVENGINYFVNEYWTAGQRQSHSLHEISYRACFKAQLPEFFISRLTNERDVVYDPFMGRGTTPVQAHLMGRAAHANDINPLSILLCRPRLATTRLPDIVAALQTVDWNRGRIQRDDLLAFYHPNTLKQLEALRLWINERAPLGSFKVDPIADWIRMVAINRLSGHSPGFFSGRSMPPNQAISVAAQRKINKKLGTTPPERDVALIIIKKSKSLLRHGSTPATARYNLCTSPAWNTPGITADSVDLVVTSPPFLDVVQYVADNWLRCWFAGIDPNTVSIDMHKTEEAWVEMVKRVLKELGRIVKRGGFIAFEVGEVRNGRVLLERLVWKAAIDFPFKRLGVMVNVQEFTKTANCWGVTNGLKGTNTNRIVLLQKT